VFYNQRHQAPQVRHHYRNPRCGAKLKVATDNPRDAFCCRGCERHFYRCRCRVCENLFSRKTGRRQVCGRSKCRHDFQRFPAQFFGARYPSEGLGHNGLRNPIKPGLKIGTESGRGFRVIAGPELSPEALRLATLPPFPALPRTSSAPLIQRGTPPVNIVSGYRFPDAPTLPPEMILRILGVRRWPTAMARPTPSDRHAGHAVLANLKHQKRIIDLANAAQR
jgi:hypothetical protein